LYPVGGRAGLGGFLKSLFPSVLILFIQEKKLGPDTLDPSFRFSDFEAALSDSRASIKSALMNQRLLAGIGNV
jgi:hypothetical protein